jgi:hypothetical protein
MSTSLRRYREEDPISVRFSPSRTYYVDSVKGRNNPDAGTLMIPFKTLQYAHDTINVDVDSIESQVEIHIAPGIYEEDLVITKNNLFWTNGFSPRAQGLVSLYGTVTINITSGLSDPFSILTAFRGLKIQNTDASKTALNIISTKQSRYLFYDLNIFSSGRCINNSSPNTIFLYDCVINLGSSSSTDDCIYFSDGVLNARDCEMYHRGTGHIVNIQQSATLITNRCVIENSNSSGPVSSVINIDNSGYTTSQLSQVSLSYIGTSSAGEAITLNNNPVTQPLFMAFSSTNVKGTTRFDGTGTILTFQNVSLPLSATGNGSITVSAQVGF